MNFIKYVIQETLIRIVKLTRCRKIQVSQWGPGTTGVAHKISKASAIILPMFVARRQAMGSPIYCEEKQVTDPRLCLTVYIVRFQTTLI